MITKQDFKKIIKKAGCYCPPFNVVLGEVSNTPQYLREYFEEIGRRENVQKKEPQRRRSLKNVK